MKSPNIQKKVYVVDDEQVIASTLALILKQRGYEATAFFNPIGVLKACEEATPSVLISDVVMPQMNGVELAIKMQHQHPSCKVLLFSGQAATAKFVEEAAERGYRFEIVSKPIHPVELLQRLESLTSTL